MDIGQGIKGVLEKHGEILIAYLYGSIVKGYGRRESDIDVGLLLGEDFEADALYAARIGMEIEKRCKLDRAVDVRILNGMPPRFLRQVINGETLLSRDEGERIRFETSVIDKYIDFKPFYEQYDRMIRERLLLET